MTTDALAFSCSPTLCFSFYSYYGCSRRHIANRTQTKTFYKMGEGSGGGEGCGSEGCGGEDGGGVAWEAARVAMVRVERTAREAAARAAAAVTTARAAARAAVARVEEATAAAARAARVTTASAAWVAARVALAVATVVMMAEVSGDGDGGHGPMAAVRAAVVAALYKLLSADAPVGTLPEGNAKEVTRRHRRVTTTVSSNDGIVATGCLPPSAAVVRA